MGGVTRDGEPSGVRAVSFISERIEPHHDGAPAPEKRRGCPTAFRWRGDVHRVARVVSEWHDYVRRGRAAHNMRPSHAAAAERRGSWGVGRDYYRVLTDSGRVFDLYYDRAPASVLDRKGGWFLLRELEPGAGIDSA
jgi:hypothetical protein